MHAVRDSVVKRALINGLELVQSNGGQSGVRCDIIEPSPLIYNQLGP